MSWNLVILILVVAAVAYVLWSRRDKGNELGAGSAAQPASAGAIGGGMAAGGPLASYDEYRRVSPSNMVNGKLTCNRCGSNLIRTNGGMASCTTCGASLYRA